MRRLVVMIVALLILVPAIAADEAEHPAYTGSAFVVYNNGQHSFDPAAYVGAAEFVQYSLRDDLGRVGPAIAYQPEVSPPGVLHGQRDPVGAPRRSVLHL